MDWTLVAAVVAVGWLLSLVLGYFRNLKDVNYLGGIRCAFDPHRMPGMILPNTWWNPGHEISWISRHTLYEGQAQDLISCVPFSGGSSLYTRSAEVARQVFGHKAGWEKTPNAVAALGPLGPNLFSTFTGGEWPRHRKIMTPSFNQKLYVQVWKECIRTYQDMMESEGWDDRSSVFISDVTVITAKIALYLIASCGFGMPLAWNDAVGEKVNGMALAECFEVTSSLSAVIANVIFPRWVLRLPPPWPLHRIGIGLDNLEEVVRRIIQARRSQGSAQSSEKESKDIFTLLIKANDAEEGEGRVKLNDTELVSNVFILMLAGHETTAKALAATLGLLACHPQEQDKCFQEISSVVRGGEDPAFEDMDSLATVTACFQEAMRLYPPVLSTTRIPMDDTTLSVPASDGAEVVVPIKKDTTLTIDFAGIGYNPRHYPFPTQFRPSRWASPDTEPLMNFIYGPRVCIGRRFAVTELVCVLTLILRDWKVEPTLQEGESLEKWRARVLDGTAHNRVGFGPGPVPLRFVRRQPAKTI